ncbi:MAG: M28 family metallopeptidase [bacterium]
MDPFRMYGVVVRLATDQPGGRWPGELGNEQALNYVQSVFEELGLEPAGTDGAYRQPYSYAYFRSLESRVSLDGSELTAEVDYEVLRYSGSATVMAEVVFVGYGLTIPPYSAEDFPRCPLPPTGYDDYTMVDVENKIVLAISKGPAGQAGSAWEGGVDWDIALHCPAGEAANTLPALIHTGYKTANARLHGARAALFVSTFLDEEDTSEINTQYAYFDPQFPVVRLWRALAETRVPELAAWAALIDDMREPQSRDLGWMAVVHAQTEVTPYIETANLVAAVPGVDPDIGHEVVVVGAHIDTVEDIAGQGLPGADDNASGVAVMLELAHLLKSAERPPDRTVVFAAWNSEEVGLLGSGSYALLLPGRYPAMDNHAYLNLDMVGGVDATGMVVQGHAEHPDLALGALMQRAVQEDGLPWAVVVYNDPSDSSSDHRSFAGIAVPAVMLTTIARHADIHDWWDTPEWTPPETLELSTRIAWATLRRLAWQDAEPDVSGTPPPPSEEEPRLSGCNTGARNLSKTGPPVLWLLLLLLAQRQVRRGPRSDPT